MRKIACRLWLFVLVLAILLAGCSPQEIAPSEPQISPTSTSSLSDLVEDCRQKTLSAGREVALTLKEMGFESPHPSVAPIFHLYSMSISPRDKIRLEESRLLRSNYPEGLTAAKISAIEATMEEDGGSCFIREPLGLSEPGLITVVCTDPKVMARVIAHEWVHEYLRSTKFGMNLNDLEESLVVLAENEITTAIYERNGWGELPPRPSVCSNEELRSVRVKVDALLAEGKIDEAEAFMEAERQRLCSDEWCPHRLNQAFFAACEAYGGGSEAGEDAYYFELLQKLRDRYPSLKKFLEDIKEISTRRELEKLAARKSIEIDEP